MKRFRDFARSKKVLDGEKIAIAQVLNKEIVVLDYSVAESKFDDCKTRCSGKCLTLQVTVDGVKRVVFTGSDVLLKQVREYEAEMPFITTIIKVDQFFTFS